ncbi:hypothetical protein V8E55_000189 [Tylopilus felleus]
MLVLPTLHTYLSQLLLPPSIHTALLFTPEGALVSYASQTSTVTTFTDGSHSSPSSSLLVPGAGMPPSSPSSVKSSGSSSASTPHDSKPGSVASIETRVAAPQRAKDDIRMVAGLGAEVWAETREEGEGMIESELGRMLVLAVEDGGVPGVEGTEPLLLLAVNGTLEADWDTMRVKACTQAGDVSRAVCEQASWDDGCDGHDCDELGEWE